MVIIKNGPLAEWAGFVLRERFTICHSGNLKFGTMRIL